MMAAKRAIVAFVLCLGGVGLLDLRFAVAQPVADIRATKHNLSADPDNTSAVKAKLETQICIFCHTPHTAQQDALAPLWNRQTPALAQIYSSYDSTTLEEQSRIDVARGPAGSSKLCLSCHDGTLAVGSVAVLSVSSRKTGAAPQAPIEMLGTDADGSLLSADVGTGFTRNLGIDLSNDHPISVTYDLDLATADGDLRPPDSEGRVFDAGGRVLIAARVLADGSPAPQRPSLPLEQVFFDGVSANNQVECGTCHDPHLAYPTDGLEFLGGEKFLRLNRFQRQGPTVGAFYPSADNICLACHVKDREQSVWPYTAHAREAVGTDAKYVYRDAAATQRDFKPGLAMWQAACMNCHDTHTVSGAKRLLREGTDEGLLSPKPGGPNKAAQEETCFQCHSSVSKSAVWLETAGDPVADIETDFNALVRMPIRNDDQGEYGEGVVPELHELDNRSATLYPGAKGRDMIEDPGKYSLQNRHVECADCHQPHRTLKSQYFYGKDGDMAQADARGTHVHDEADATTLHSNIISGALRGTTGVEPDSWFATAFHPGNVPTTFTEKYGDPGLSNNTSVGNTYVTREYQICFKCHSNYAYGLTPPSTLGAGRTQQVVGGANSYDIYDLEKYTNQAMEFQAPVAHQGEGQSNLDTGAYAAAPDFFQDGTGSLITTDFITNNHRAWHPVMDATGRELLERSTSSNAWLAPWNYGVGTQTMYCSDCHGSDVTSLTSVSPDRGNGQPWGPHGSNNGFLLKGNWLNVVADNADANLLCYKCHNAQAYANSTTALQSGFSTAVGEGALPAGANLHQYHALKVNGYRCTACHSAVPHGFKNKAFLVNLNDVGPEVNVPPYASDFGSGIPLYNGVGQPFPAGSQVRIDPDTTDGQPAPPFTAPPYYYKAMLKIVSFPKSGEWTSMHCGSMSNKLVGISWMTGANSVGADESCSNIP